MISPHSNDGAVIAILLVIGVMDLAAMAVVAIFITLERLAPAGERVSRGMERSS